MMSLWKATMGSYEASADDFDGVEFWGEPERAGWLTKQGEYIKTWRRRWFVLKQGKLFWFKESFITRASRPRGVIPVADCLTVKGAEDVLNRPFAFELSTRNDTMYFIADSDKEKEEWINSIGRSIVQQSRSVTDDEVLDYDSVKSLVKRNFREGAEEGSRLPFKRRHFVSNLFKGANYGRALQESVSCLEPMIRRIVQEAVDRAIDPYLRSSENQTSTPRRFQLQFRGNLPHTLFTNNRVLSEDRGSIRIVLYDSISKGIITSGPLSALKVTIVVLDGDFVPDDRVDWTAEDFNRKSVKNREGKRPLVTGELTVPLQNGVGDIGEICFTDNSSWIRSGKFRLGAKLHTSSADFGDIKEALSNAFKVKDHRGESYQKHHPPSLDDEIWRLEKIAKDGPSHKKLQQSGISCVRDFLKLYFTDQSTLRAILKTVTNKKWDTIITHAQTCSLDDKKYTYTTTQGTGLLFNSVCKVVGVTFDGRSYLSTSSLNTYQMNIVELLKQQAYKNLSEWVTFCDPSIGGYPMMLESPGADRADSLTNPNFELHGVGFHEQEMTSDPSTMTPPYKPELEQENCSFDLQEGSLNGFGTSYYSPGDEFYVGGDPTCLSGSNYAGSQLLTYDLPATDNFQVDSPAWQGNGLFFDPDSHGIGVISSNSGIIIPRKGRSMARWCKVLAVVKWRILVRRNVAARRWRPTYAYA